MESKNADGVGVVSSRQRDGSDEAGGAEETENTEDMLPPLRGGMEGEDNSEYNLSKRFLARKFFLTITA